MEKFFIYGTLAPGKENHGMMSGISGSWQKAFLKGILKEEGWGAELGSPGIIPSDDGQEVEGFLFSSEELAAHWVRLDEFEGKEYQRIIVNVRTETNDNVEAQVYSLRSYSMSSIHVNSGSSSGSSCWPGLARSCNPGSID